MTSPPEAAPSQPRYVALDALRGGALGAMLLYHLSWDLANFGYIDTQFPSIFGMRLFSHLIAATFLAIAGFSLGLAHAQAIRWRAFFKRFFIIAGAALLVTAATYLSAPGEAIFFGVLHCIAAATLVSALLLRAPAAASLALAGLFFLGPTLIAAPSLNDPAIMWLGLGNLEPQSLDWRPLLPWGGFLFLGLGLAQLDRQRVVLRAAARWRPGPFGQGLAVVGRHTLALYLVHQPIFFAIFMALAQLSASSPSYQSACAKQCENTGAPASRCASVCACIEKTVGSAGRNPKEAQSPGAREERRNLAAIIQACAKAP